MSYISREGKRPAEFASKSSHSHIIKDNSVQEFLKRCNLPKLSGEVEIKQDVLLTVEDIKSNPINFIIAVDGGFSEVAVKKEFPSSKICFFQYGALFFRLSDLDEISEKPFIDPEDIAKLKEIQRLEFVLPTKNVTLANETCLIGSVRKSLYDFFLINPNDDKFIDTLKWLIFEEHESSSCNEYQLANCPACDQSRILLKKDKMLKDYSFNCEKCSGKIYITDVFRLHEAMDNELGAGGILGYLTNLLEQILIIHLIRVMLKIQPTLLEQTLFIKDGPLAFFGQTANMHKPVRRLINFLKDKNNIFLAGLEKTGAFVEHANEIAQKLKPGQILLLDNKYIYKYILPSTNADLTQPYARTSYYGAKLIYKAKCGGSYVITLPTKDENVVLNPKRSDFKNLDIILNNIEKLKCDMYDSALIPIALANKLVSLSNHPSAVLLEKFAKKVIRK